VSDFDPSGVAIQNGNFLGFPKISKAEADFVFLSIPWDVTTSYRPGTHRGPSAIINASYQLDLFSPELDEVWKLKLFTEPLSSSLFERTLALNQKIRPLAEAHIANLEKGQAQPDLKRLEQINQACEAVYLEYLNFCREALAQGKTLLTLGGDHSVSLGPILAHAERFPRLSVLHIDAHADLREAYEGFTHSHASILFNVLNPMKHNSSGRISKLVQVGIRDVSQFEVELAKNDSRVEVFFDRELKHAAFRNKSWETQVEEILKPLTDQVYLTFDIDGLDPKLCPNTGTPVPGGLSFEQAVYLIHAIHRSGRQLVGADLVEVAPDAIGNSEWDANVGARLAFEILVALAKSRGHQQ
jgi:agmatinase